MMISKTAQYLVLVTCAAILGCGALTADNDGASVRGEIGTSHLSPDDSFSTSGEPVGSPPPGNDDGRIGNKVHTARGCTKGVPVYVDGERRGEICENDASREDLTVVDLSDRWTPFIFTEYRELGENGRQPYRETYLRLADEQFEGSSWRRRTQQYLELYGIFPTFRVIRGRLSEAERHQCHDEVDDEVLAELSEEIPPTGRQGRSQRNAIRRLQFIKQRLLRELANQEVATIGELESIARLRPLVKQFREGRALVDSVAVMQEHLQCDGLLGSRVREGTFDGPTLIALRLWQRRHMIVSRGSLDEDTRRVLAIDSRETDFHTALRALRERVIDATGLIQDGSALHDWGTVLDMDIDSESFRFTAGQQPAPGGAPDLISPATEAAARSLGWTSPEATLAFLDALGEDGTRSLRVALPLPEAPDYHAEHMELRAEIDRGDVYYELGNRRRNVEHRPILTLYARQGGREIALMRWGTTIGGWQPERTDDGGIGMRYKNSPPGERIWRDVIASPAWLPPPSTPDDELVSKRGEEWRPKLSLFGPGYRSAYGLVMMMHHKVLEGTNADGSPRLRDEGVRSHGSVTYTSILGGFSHGCHRLYNHLAVRLANYLLRHRNHEPRGSLSVDFRREVTVEEQDVEIELTSRGYLYELTPPVPIEVLEGNIIGRQQEPSRSFRNVRYPEEESEEGEGDAGVAASPDGAPVAAQPTSSP